MEKIDELIAATFALYRKAFFESVQSLRRCWPMLLGSFALYLIFRALSDIISLSGIVGSLVMGIISVLLLSIYFTWIAAALDRDRVTFRTLFQFDREIAFSTLSVSFALWIISYLSQFMAQSAGQVGVILLINFAVVVIFNPIPEVIMQQRAEGFSTLGRSFEFVRENWLEWFVPIVLVTAPWFFIGSELFLLRIAASQVLLPVRVVFDSFLLFAVSVSVVSTPGPAILVLIPATIFANWFMYFRLHLYRELSESTRRTRVYRWKQR
jgi:hypothetical protein